MAIQNNKGYNDYRLYGIFRKKASYFHESGTRVSQRLHLKVFARYPVRLGMQIATPLYPPLSGGQVSTPQNRTYQTWGTAKLTPMVRLGMQIA